MENGEVSFIWCKRGECAWNCMVLQAIESFQFYYETIVYRFRSIPPSIRWEILGEIINFSATHISQNRFNKLSSADQNSVVARAPFRETKWGFESRENSRGLLSISLAAYVSCTRERKTREFHGKESSWKQIFLSSKNMTNFEPQRQLVSKRLLTRFKIVLAFFLLAWIFTRATREFTVKVERYWTSHLLWLWLETWRLDMRTWSRFEKVPGRTM